MLNQDYEIIVECLVAGSEFEVTVRETDTIGYLKYRIKKYEGIPVSQQHLLYQQRELKDSTVLKDVPIVRGSRLTLVLGMRGGPISARRVVTDCENWYDLSDVLSGTNRSQLTPTEPLTISTPGVKVLLYKDCKKNINRLMKLRKHHLHGGASGVGATASSGSSSSGSGGGSATLRCPSASARTQLKFLDSSGSKSGGPVDGVITREEAARDQQWLMDNIITLKKMMELRQSMDAKKKKKKPRTGEPKDSVSEANEGEDEDGYLDDLSQDLKDVQNVLEMQEKLQRWLHRVASNVPHLNGTEALATHNTAVASQPPQSSSSASSSSSCHHTTRPHLTSGGSSSNSHPLNIFDRMRRKTGGTVGGSYLHPAFHSSQSTGTATTASASVNVGGARKKDSSYPMLSGGMTAMMPTLPVDEFYMGYSSAGHRPSACNSLRPKAREGHGVDDEEDDEEETTYTRLSIEEIDRRLAAANDDIPEGVFTEDIEQVKAKKQLLSNSGQYEERLLTQFYDNPSVQCENLFKAFANGQSGRSSGAGGVCGGLGGGDASKFRWRFQSTDPKPPVTEAKGKAFLSSSYKKWTDTSEQQPAAVEGCEESTVNGEEEAVQARETVIIEKAAEGEEESLLAAACSEILNDPDAFEEEDEDEEDEEGDEEEEDTEDEDGTELLNFMRLESEESDGAEGELSCLLKAPQHHRYFDAPESDDDPVLLFEEEDTGAAAFQFSGRSTASKHEANFWPNFDVDNQVPVVGAADKEAVLSVNQRPPTIVPELVTSDEDDLIAGGSCPEAEALEFDDFTYYPAKSTSAKNTNHLLTPPTLHGDFDEKAFLPRIANKPCHLGGRGDVSFYRPPEPRMGMSLPEIIQGQAAAAAAKKKRDREEANIGGGGDSSGRGRAPLPEINLLESDLKRMGLEDILNDNDDSFERTIKRHFADTRNRQAQRPMSGAGECLLGVGSDMKRMKQQDWQIPAARGEKEEAAVAAADVSEEPPKQAVVKGNRCAKCNKKLGIIMIMKCHCGLIFCAQHRYAEAHDCAYDFKEEGKRILAKENPLVVGEKLPKI